MAKIRFYVGAIIFLSFTLFCKIPCSAAHRVQPTDDTIVIVIDPGHGGENLGTIENGFEEKGMTLLTAQAMYDELCLYDNVEVYMTRTEDVDVDLETRAEYAAGVGADFLFSIHYNASVKHNLFGSEVWVPVEPPYNAYGYQFGSVQLEAMENMGFNLRGIKTRLSEKGTGENYYGILRHCVNRSVPAVIIEHCHVDEERDYLFCDTEDELIAFGQADATAVAKYFGLKSTRLGVDYSDSQKLPVVERNKQVRSTLFDETPPDICMIELAELDENNGTIVLDVVATDYDSPLLYYDYSYDGGRTYSPLQIWPGSDVLQGTYQDTAQISFQVPSETQPDIILRAYNMFDASKESNRIELLRTILYHEDGTDGVTDADQSPPEGTEDKKLPGTDTFAPAVSEDVVTEEGVSFFDFLLICLILVIGLFVMLLITRMIMVHKRNKRRRQRRKLEGNNRYQPR